MELANRVCFIWSEASVTLSNFISLWQNRFRFSRSSVVWAVSPECPFFECLRWKRRTCLLLTGRKGKVTRMLLWNAKVPVRCFCVENQVYNMRDRKSEIKIGHLWRVMSLQLGNLGGAWMVPVCYLYEYKNKKQSSRRHQ